MTRHYPEVNIDLKAFFILMLFSGFSTTSSNRAFVAALKESHNL